jgi:putative hydrolase of the HAD superfamily
LGRNSAILNRAIIFTIRLARKFIYQTKRFIKHIFFDLDHTLWDFEANSIETLGEMYAHFEIDQKTTVNREYFINRYVYHNENLWDLYRQNKVTKARLRDARFLLALNDVGIEDKEMARKMGDFYLDFCPRKTKLMDGTIELLEELKGNYHLHILSNGFHETQLIKLKESKLDSYFNEVITSERAQAKKPNYPIYDFATKVTEAPKDGTLMIGDNLEIDVVGAINFGWDAIHFNPAGIEHEYQHVRSIPELLPLIVERG